VASVRNKPDADRLIDKLTRRGYPAYLLTSQIKGKGTWHRVRIGAYPTGDAAKPVLAELRRAGMKPMLVKTK
jgi:cell division septation protein DedD